MGSIKENLFKAILIKSDLNFYSKNKEIFKDKQLTTSDYDNKLDSYIRLMTNHMTVCEGSIMDCNITVGEFPRELAIKPELNDGTIAKPDNKPFASVEIDPTKEFLEGNVPSGKVAKLELRLR